jgi:hypothetical protein
MFHDSKNVSKRTLTPIYTKILVQNVIFFVIWRGYLHVVIIQTRWTSSAGPIIHRAGPVDGQ